MKARDIAFALCTSQSAKAISLAFIPFQIFPFQLCQMSDWKIIKTMNREIYIYTKNAEKLSRKIYNLNHEFNNKLVLKTERRYLYTHKK